MQKIFDSVSDVVASKLNNPFTNTFLVSWTIFNWKPLLYFILSKSDVETKICTIFNLYSDYCHVLIFPLLSTFLILLGIPKILVWMELINKRTNNKRKDNAKLDQIGDIDIKLEIAKKTIESERLIKIAQNMGEENKRYDELQNELRFREEELDIEKTKNAEKDRAHLEEKNRINKELNDLIKENTELEGKLMDVSDVAKQTSRELQDLHNSVQEKNSTISEKEIMIKILAETKPVLLDSAEGRILIMRSDSELQFYNIDNNQFYNWNQIFRIYDSPTTNQIYDPAITHLAINKFRNRPQQ